MDKQEAKQTLLLYRPGTDDGNDPQMAEALTWVQRDPELAQWFDEHCEVYKAIRGKLKEIPVPADLQQEILHHEAERRGRIVHLRVWLSPLAAAAVIAFAAVILWNTFKGPHQENFVELRDHVVRESQRPYGMTPDPDLADIHTKLLANQCPDYSLTKPLEKLGVLGYAPVEWHQQKVSMVCLTDAKNKPVMLFVMNTAQVQNVPGDGETEFAKIHRFNSASRVVNGKVYIVAGPQDNAELKAYLD